MLALLTGGLPPRGPRRGGLRLGGGRLRRMLGGPGPPAKRERAAHQLPVPADRPVSADLEVGPAELVADRTRAAVAGWLDARSSDWLAQVGTVALDPWRGYASALVTPLAHATVVVDYFHAIRLANMVVDQVRRRVQQATLGHRGRKHDPLYRIRKLLLTAAEQLTERGRARLRTRLTAGDPTGEVAAAWQGKELLRAVYAAAGTAAARAELERFYRWCDGVQVAELSRLARTVRAWEAEILAFHATGGCPNGPTEALNLLIKKVKRVGHGFRNFADYRLRLLLHCGVTWRTHPTARLRGRSPAWWRRALHQGKCVRRAKAQEECQTSQSEGDVEH